MSKVDFHAKQKQKSDKMAITRTRYKLHTRYGFLKKIS